MKKLTVHLGERSYPLFVGAPLAGLGAWLKKQPFTRRALIVTNTTVNKLYGAALADSLVNAGFQVRTIALKDGEQYKTLAAISSIYQAAVKAQLDRRSPVIALGGGVVGDLAGFAAATYLRGVPFIQVPTTLLAMVDSSVGGKTGFDLEEGKNLVGAFYQPKAVWIDVTTLKTLPARQVSNGMAEVIKYGVIMDADFFKYLEKTIGKEIPSAKELEKIVSRCCQLKASVVEQDEFERKGVREILNFGHTFGHAVETLTGYTTYYHGEAVAIGMVIAGRLAVRLGTFTYEELRRIEQLLSRAKLPLHSAKKLSTEKMLAVMGRDKKVLEGKLRFVLPEKIGKAVVKADVPSPLVREVVA